MELDKAALRIRLRKQRVALSAKQHLLAAQGLAKQANSLYRLQQASSVLSYLPTAGEIDPTIATQNLSHTELYLPRITHYANRTMKFYPAGNPRTVNRFNIAEPAPIGVPIPINRFDVVLLPLVAFDQMGNRIGMGGGFYDRALAGRTQGSGIQRPYLIGVAHHFQMVNSIAREAWDIPLNAILTDQQTIVF